MSTKELKPVYSAAQVVKLMQLRVEKDVLDQFTKLPAGSPRRITVWHPGLSLVEQAELPLVRERNLLRIWENARKWNAENIHPIAGYYSVCLPAPSTERRSIAEQETLIAPFGEKACPVAIATWTWLVHKVATGESLGKGMWMRCRESTSARDHLLLLAFTNLLHAYGGVDSDWMPTIPLASLGNVGSQSTVNR